MIAHASSDEEAPAELSITEEVIIDEALKEKQKIVKEKLEQGEKLVRTMTSRIIQIQKYDHSTLTDSINCWFSTEGEDAVRDDKSKLEQIMKEMNELEKALESTQDDSSEKSKHINHHLHQSNSL